jgi:hypothetical protein
MANEWLRLWHDMPTDPKWRTIARASGQPIALVQAVYLHMLVDASRNVTRGHVTVTAEDMGSALDVTEAEIQCVLDAMEGRVIEAGALSGWDARQPKKEDAGNPSTGAKSAAERQRDKRARDAEKDAVTAGHDESRKVTLDKDKDESKDISVGGADLPQCNLQAVIDLYHEVLPELPTVRLMTESRKKAIAKQWRFVLTSKKSDGTRRAFDADQAMTWLRDYFSRARDNDFLMGRTGRQGEHANWQCDLDFLLTEKGMKHVIEKTKETA